MLGYSKEKFECFITHIENDVASVDVIDKDGEKSFMEIPKDVFVSSKIIFSAGTIFSFTLKNFLGWEKAVFKPVVRKKYTPEEFDKIKKHYEEKYGDV